MKPRFRIKTEVGDTSWMSAPLPKLAGRLIQSMRFAGTRRLVTLLARNYHALHDLVRQTRRVISEKGNPLATAADKYVALWMRGTMQNCVRNDIRRIHRSR